MFTNFILSVLYVTMLAFGMVIIGTLFVEFVKQIAARHK